MSSKKHEVVLRLELVALAADVKEVAERALALYNARPCQEFATIKVVCGMLAGVLDGGNAATHDRLRKAVSDWSQRELAILKADTN